MTAARAFLRACVSGCFEQVVQARGCFLFLGTPSFFSNVLHVQQEPGAFDRPRAASTLLVSYGVACAHSSQGILAAPLVRRTTCVGTSTSSSTRLESSSSSSRSGGVGVAWCEVLQTL